MVATHQHRNFNLKTPLGKDVLLVRRMSGIEALSEPFLWDFDLLSEKGDINAEDILGQKVSLAFTMANGKKRYFHGYVTEFSQGGGWLQRYYCYQAKVRPWYWLLTRTADCRIFQDMTVPQIFEKVVQQYGFTDYEMRLSGSYQTREYCVQYRETDFNFLSRLLEHEGIYFFFEHTETRHTLVLVDDPGQHKTFDGYETVPYYAPGGKDVLRERDHLETWSYTKTVQPGSYATTDFDFEKPRKSLASSATISRSHQQANFEMFDYPGALSQLELSQSDATANVRIQELHAGYMVASGHGNAAGLATGWKFTLEKFPRKDLNMAYVITRATYTLISDEYESKPDEYASGTNHETSAFAVSIDAIDARTPFRPPRRSRKPMIHGAQTAMVVGPVGEEIYTDKHGRVKVQFPWDRYGKQDEQSSCWIRVAQMWAGKNWGMIQVPRIGQEVIVTFLEGDPDRPIITGRVYNGDSMAPYGLPESATQSGIKSRSTKGGGEANFNEIRFEDLKGSEQLYIHAEKNMDGVVENDQTHQVGHDRTKTVNHDEMTQVGNNRTENVGNNEAVTVGVNRTHTVGANEQVNIGANRTESVGANETIGIAANRSISVGANETATVAMLRTHNVGINEMINIGAAQEMNIGAAQAITVGAAQVTSVGLEQMTNVGLHRTVNVGGSQSHNVGASRKAHVTANDHLHVGNSLTIHAGDSVTIKTGESSITMHRDGTITIKGKMITIHGSSDIKVKATGDVSVKGKNVKHN